MRQDDLLAGAITDGKEHGRSGRTPMLRYPMHGFAKRVDDAVARAMGFLQAKGMDGAMASPPAFNPDFWQALARWKEPASIRWQVPSASRGIVIPSKRPQSFRSIVKPGRDEGHQRIQRG
jgi:hypothetical protein